MGSIPLAANNLKVPEQQPNALDQYARIMQIKAAQQQQALMPGAIQKQQQEIQAGALENQTRQQDLDARKALNQAYQTSVTTDAQGKASFDPDELQSTLATGPAAYKTPEVMEGITKFQKSRVDLQNSMQDLKAKQTDMIGGAASAVKAAGYDPTLAHSLLDSLPPSPQLDQIRGMIDSNPQGFKQMIDSAVAQSPKTAEAYKNTQQGNAAAAQAAKVTAEINPNAPADPNIARQKYEGILQQIGTKGFGSIAPADMQWARAYENAQKKTTTQADSLGVTSTNTSGPSGLAASRAGAPAAPVATPQGVTPPAGAPARPALGGAAATPPAQPSAASSIVDMIGQYKMNPTMLQRLIVKHPELVAQVGQKYPGWQQEDYNAKNKILLDYTKDAGSGQIGAINTALGHLGELNEAAKALDQNNIPLLHSIASKLGAAVGGDAATTYTAILHRVGPEMTSAYVKGGGGQGERGANEEDFAVGKGQKQIMSNIGESAKLLYSKMDSLSNNWDKTYQPTRDQDKFENRFITPAAKNMIQSLSAQAPGGGSASFSVKAPNGKTYTFKDQASADAFRAKLPQ